MFRYHDDEDDSDMEATFEEMQAEERRTYARACNRTIMPSTWRRLAQGLAEDEEEAALHGVDDV